MLLRVNVSILIVIVMMIVTNHCRIVVVAMICGYEFSFLIRCTANLKMKEKNLTRKENEREIETETLYASDLPQ